MRDHGSLDEDRAVAEIAERLRDRFPDVPDERITAAVDDARASFDSAKVRDFVPLLIEKEAKARLAGTG